MIANRLVLDTNVCLDLFFFRDPRWATLHTALETGKIEAYTRSDCRSEWLLVLHYARFGMTARKIAQCTTEFDALITCMPMAVELSEVACNSVGNTQYCVALPRCSDTDDQKFLETTRDSNAAILITKDKALLKLNNKLRRAGLFEILTPQAWLALQQTA